MSTVEQEFEKARRDLSLHLVARTSKGVLHVRFYLVKGHQVLAYLKDLSLRDEQKLREYQML